jgi:hypothetical protein
MPIGVIERLNGPLIPYLVNGWSAMLILRKSIIECDKLGVNIINFGKPTRMSQVKKRHKEGEPLSKGFVLIEIYEVAGE